MSQNQICTQCKAYNHPRREKCWQCGRLLVVSNNLAPHKTSRLTETQIKLFSIGGISLFMLASLFVLGTYFVFPQKLALLPTETPVPLYELIWKIEEDVPLHYLAQIGNGTNSISMGKNLPDEIATRIPGDFIYKVLNVEVPIHTNYVLDAGLQKNSQGNISVEMILTDVERSPNDLTSSEKNLTIQALNTSSFVQGEISTHGQLVSTYLSQDQKNLLSLFFELPQHPMQVGDTWSIGAICITVEAGQFTLETSSIENQVTLSKIYETPNHELIAVLDYRIVENLEGTQMVPLFLDEPVSASMQCNGIGQGEFLVEQGHWKQFDFQYTNTITGITDGTMTQNFSLSLTK